MSTVNFIAATQSSTPVTSGKSTTQQTALAASLLADPAKDAEQVSLSSASIALSADENNMAHARTPAQEHLIRAASSDRESAEKIAYGMASVPSTIFYDISGVGGGEEVNKMSSGRIIDDAFKSKFESEAAVIDSRRLEIYQSEKAKGTDPLQILIKMLDFTNSQSQDYLEATGWGYMGRMPT